MRVSINPRQSAPCANWRPNYIAPEGWPQVPSWLSTMLVATARRDEGLKKTLHDDNPLQRSELPVAELACTGQRTVSGVGLAAGVVVVAKVPAGAGSQLALTEE